MDFNFTEEQDMMRESLSRLVRDKYDFATRHKLSESDAGWSPEFWAQLAELGLLMAPFSEDDGGLGGGTTEAMIVAEELGKGMVIAPFIPSVVCGGGFIKYFGDAAQKAAYLEPIMAGEAIFAFAYAEPQGRYDLANLVTTAKPDGADYSLNGHKSVVMGAPMATHFIVTVRTGGGQCEHEGVSVFIVPKDADGLTTRDYPTVDGRRASEVYFENVRVPASAMIGPEGQALPAIEKIVDEATVALCAEACGAMGVVNAQTLDYTRTRKQFGTAIGKFQVLQHRQVDMFMEYEQSVSMLYMANIKLDEVDKARKMAVSAAKSKIGQAARFVGQNAVQTFGGMGVTDEMAVGHYFKRLTIFEGEFGSVAFHLKRYRTLSK